MSVIAVHVVVVLKPAPHCVHVAQLDEPVEAAYVPPAQALQLAAPGPEKVPTAHGEQTVSVVAVHDVDA